MLCNCHTFATAGDPEFIPGSCSYQHRGRKLSSLLGQREPNLARAVTSLLVPTAQDDDWEAL